MLKKSFIYSASLSLLVSLSVSADSFFNESTFDIPSPSTLEKIFDNVDPDFESMFDETINNTNNKDESEYNEPGTPTLDGDFNFPQTFYFQENKLSQNYNEESYIFDLETQIKERNKFIESLMAEIERELYNETLNVITQKMGNVTIEDNDDNYNALLEFVEEKMIACSITGDSREILDNTIENLSKVFGGLNLATEKKRKSRSHIFDNNYDGNKHRKLFEDENS